MTFSLRKTAPKRERTVRNDFLTALEQHVGYRCQPNGNSVYGARYGITGTDPVYSRWDGAFLQFVADETEYPLPNLVDPEHALAEAIRRGNITKKPQAGDLVFYVQADKREPRVGIVTDSTGWKDHGEIRAVEGQTASQNGDQFNGVRERVRADAEILAFVRPFFSETRRDSIPETPESQKNWVRPTILTAGRQNPRITAVQAALGDIYPELRGMREGIFDLATRKSLARFQRELGRRGNAARGEPDTITLQELARLTGRFTVKD